MKKIIFRIFLLILILSGGIYFVRSECGQNVNLFIKEQAIECFTFLKNDVLEVFRNNIKDFKTSNIGDVITQVQKQIFSPEPLEVKNDIKGEALTKTQIIAETNLQRKENGLSDLVENEKLSKAAMAKIKDMFENQYFEHISPSGVNPGQLVQSYGYDYIITGENLILGNFKSEKKLVQYWMDSKGHRENILNNRYTEIGVAVIKGTYKGESVYIAVQEFGLPVSACSEPDLTLKAKIDADKNSLESLSLQIDEKLSEVEKTNKKAENYNILVSDYNLLIDQYQQSASNLKSLIEDYNNQVTNFNQCVAGS